MAPTVCSAPMSRFMPDTMKKMDITGGVKLLIWRNSFLSLVRFMYTAPNTIQDNKGEISMAAQMPLKPSSMAIASISRLSLLLAGISRRLKKYPQKIPSTITSRL